MFKLVRIDMDRTLLTSDRKITDRTRDAIQKAIAKGVNVVICTGRPLTGIIPSLTYLDIHSPNLYVIGYNGAGVFKGDPLVPVLGHKLSDEEIRLCHKVALESDVGFMFIDEEYIYTLLDEPTPVMVMDAEVVSTQVVTVPEDAIPVGNYYKGMFIAEKPELDAAQDTLTAKVGEYFHLVRSEDFLYEVLPKGIHKGSAVIELADHLGIARDEIMALGDGRNDIEMIESAGFGVAMANSVPELLAIADYVTASNDEDGVAIALEKFVLGDVD